MEYRICALKQPKILVVDDLAANLDILSGLLEGLGYEIRAAVTGELALQAARHDPPDLILLDVKMPGMDGYALCSILKSEEKLKEIPVIFLSGLTEQVDKIKAFGCGGVDYITKPFQFEEVAARIATHLELSLQRRRVQEKNEKLRELEKMRSCLSHMLVHDLRSPLMAIASHLDMIRRDTDNVLTPGSQGDISETLKAAEIMIRLIGDILDTNKLEEGKMKLALAPCNLGAIIEECVLELKPLYPGGEILFARPEGQPAVLADRELISRVVQNLLANAIKFTPSGGRIILDLVPAAGVVRVSVHDNGPGIASDNRQRIFDKFAQAGLRAGSQRYSSGLGLTFCKLAVEAHSGSIGVDSKEGEGSTFWFELPVPGPAGAKE